MAEQNDKQAINLLAIRNASGIKERIEEQQKLKDTARKYILEEKNKDSLDGKTNQDKINEYKDRYKYNAFDVMLILPGLVKFFLNKNKSDKLKELNEDIETKVEEQIEKTAKAFYGNDKNMDEARRQEMAAKMKNNVNSLLEKIIEKNNDLSENLAQNGALLNQSGLEKLLLAQMDEIVNNDPSLKGYFNIPGQPTQTAQADVQAKPNPVLLQNYRQENDLTLIKNPQSLLTAVQERINKNQDVVVDKAQLNNVLKINDVNPVQHFTENPNVKFTVKQQIEGNKFVVGPLR